MSYGDLTQPPGRLSGAELRRTYGASGLLRSGGFVYEDAPPPGKTWADIFISIRDGEPTVGAVLAAIETLASRVTWTVQPADDTPAAAALAQLVDEALHDMDQPWVEVLSEIWTMLPFGWALLEQTYKQRQGDVEEFTTDTTGDGAATYQKVYGSKFSDGLIGWASWRLRAQETRYRWEFTPDGDVAAMIQIAPPIWKPTTIPMQKCLLFRTTTRKGNPEGRSLLRNLYIAWQRKVNIERIEGIGIERDLAGLPVMEIPMSVLQSTDPADQAVVASFQKMVQNIKRDANEGILMGQEYDEATRLPLYVLKLLSSGGARQFDTDKIIQRYEQRMVMAMLADFIFVGHESRGSFALIQDKTRLFRDSLDTYLTRICSVVNTVAIPRLLRLNGMDTSLSPELVHSDVNEIDLASLAAYVTAIQPLFTASGQAPDPELLRHLLEVADLPVPADAAPVDQANVVAQRGETSATPESDETEVPA